MADDAVTKAIATWPAGTFDVRETKIVCTLTGHELPRRVDALHAYAASRGFQRALELAHDYAQYAPHIVPAEDDATKLRCNLTNRVLNRTRAQVEAHVRGQRFQRRLRQQKQAEEKAAAAAADAADAAAAANDDEEMWLPEGESGDEGGDEGDEDGDEDGHENGEDQDQDEDDMDATTASLDEDEDEQPESEPEPELIEQPRRKRTAPAPPAAQALPSKKGRRVV